MQLHYHSYGRGTPLVILHGLFGSLDNWQSVGKRLAEHCQVLAVDLRNHGASPHSAEMNYPIMAEDIEELLQNQRIAQASILGHSLGGKVAMEFALRYPEKTHKLVVADMSPRAYPPQHEKILAALRALDLTARQSRQEIDTALAPAIPEAAVRQFLLKSVTREPGGAFRWQFNLASLTQNYARLGEGLAGGRIFDKPALFIRGAQSDFIPDTDLVLIRRLFPQSEIQTIPNAGHWVHAHAPHAFARAALEFLGAQVVSQQRT